MSQEHEASRQDRRPYIPIGVETAAAWSWRLILIAAATLGVLWLLRYFSEITVPLAIGVLGAALLIHMVNRLQRWGLPRLASVFVVVIGLLVILGGATALVGQQLSTQFDELRESVVEGIAQTQTWAKDGPLNLSDQQLSDGFDRLKDTVASTDSNWWRQATQVGTQVGHFVAGFFITLFAMFFFLYEGDRIWSWVVGFFPRRARSRIFSSGEQAWHSLTSFVRATVLVALVDAIGIAVVALILDVPLAAAIAILVFLGAFVPIVGAFASGLVAVLVALVAHGPLVALLMFAGVVAVQQLESQVLQPFLMARFVSIHPLAIIVAIAAGIIVAGIVGALIAVPLAAVANTVVRHLVAGDPKLEDLGGEADEQGTEGLA